MMVVHKYPISLDDFGAGDEIEIEMPRGAAILLVAVQRDRTGQEIPCVWARVDPNAAMVTHYFRLAGTGHELNSRVGRHVGSFLMAGGKLVFHLFERKP